MSAVLDGMGSLTERVRRAISEQIASGAYRPGEQLPTEKEYASSLGVSLITVRNALASLVAAGHIERGSGRGTFVSMPKVPYEIRLMRSSTDSLRATGVPFELRVVTAESATPPEEVRGVMKLAPRARAFHLQRVAIVRDGAGILLDSWVRPSVAKAFDASKFAEGASLYAMIAEQGIEMVHAGGRLELVYADDEEAGLLRRPFGVPLLAYESTARDQEGRIVERARALYDADRFSLTVSPEVPA